jgi:hypothetical protein
MANRKGRWDESDLRRLRRELDWAYENLGNSRAAPPSQRAERFRALVERNIDAYLIIYLIVQRLQNRLNSDHLLAELERELVKDRLKLNRRPGGDGATCFAGDGFPVSTVVRLHAKEGSN